MMNTNPKIEEFRQKIIKLEKRLQKIENSFSGKAGKGISRMNQSYAIKRCCGKGYPKDFEYCPFCRKQLDVYKGKD